MIGCSGRPNVKLYELPKAGHWVHVDDPQGLMDLITPTFTDAAH
jgi:pimeloyl-ACP methyl ester carboxylesterase